MIEPNYRYRAITGREAERRAVEDSFARSVLWGFKVEAAEEGRVLVDATDFFVRDAHGIADRAEAVRPGELFSSTTTAAPSTCRTPGGSPRTPRSRRSSPSPPPTTPARSSARRRRRPRPSPSASGSRFVELPPLEGEGSYRPGRSTPGSAPSGSSSTTMRNRSPNRSRPAGSSATDWRSGTRPPRSPSRSSRSSTTSTPAPPSRSARPWSRGPPGGPRRSRRPASATPSGSRSCPTTPTRWTSATT